MTRLYVRKKHSSFPVILPPLSQSISARPLGHATGRPSRCCPLFHLAFGVVSSADTADQTNPSGWPGAPQAVELLVVGPEDPSASGAGSFRAAIQPRRSQRVDRRELGISSSRARSVSHHSCSCSGAGLGQRPGTWAAPKSSRQHLSNHGAVEGLASLRRPEALRVQAIGDLAGGLAGPVQLEYAIHQRRVIPQLLEAADRAAGPRGG